MIEQDRKIRRRHMTQLPPEGWFTVTDMALRLGFSPSDPTSKILEALDALVLRGLAETMQEGGVRLYRPALRRAA